VTFELPEGAAGPPTMQRLVRQLPCFLLFPTVPCKSCRCGLRRLFSIHGRRREDWVMRYASCAGHGCGWTGILRNRRLCRVGALGGSKAGGPGAALGWIEADRFKISDHDRTVVVAERPPESEVARPLTPRHRLRALGLTKRPAAANDAAWPSVLAPAGCGVWSRS
jgi:hypothetical protein